jgi:pSer/pThr/pTyr-binding forkhead associated (FHA) protein
VIPCSFCGKTNQDDARFCIDCGKSLTPSEAQIKSPVAVQVAAASLDAKRMSASGPPGVSSRAPGANTPARPGVCAQCGGRIDASLPFCAYCGTRTGAPIPPGTPQPSSALAAAAGATTVRGSGPRFSLLDARGTVKQTYVMSGNEAVVGRGEGDIQFADDVYLSPVHAQFTRRDGALFVRDLGSRNGTWLFVDGRHRLSDGDVVLVGSQLLRFRRLGYPGPHPPEADRTRRLGSLIPSADIAVLAQLRADGSVRDTFHLSPGRNVLIGREKGDWLFPYDQTMSSTHAEVRSEDSDFVVGDAGSRNGIAVAVRGERTVGIGQRVMVGDRVLRVESL